MSLSAFKVINRQAECTMAIMMLGTALTIAIDPSTLSRGGFVRLGTVGFDALTLAVTLFFAGLLRGISLLANGQWPRYGPIARALGAGFGAVLWSQMAYSIYVWSAAKGYLSMGVSVYLTLAFSEFISITRALRDARAA